jgi:hypothetical protein
VRQSHELRAVLRTLGYDPEEHRLCQRVSPAGLLIIRGDEDPEPNVQLADVAVRFYSKKTFSRMCQGDGFQARYDDFLAGERAGIWPETVAEEQSA